MSFEIICPLGMSQRNSSVFALVLFVGLPGNIQKFIHKPCGQILTFLTLSLLPGHLIK